MIFVHQIFFCFCKLTIHVTTGSFENQKKMFYLKEQKVSVLLEQKRLQ